MDDLRELYQATILGHNKKPRNFRVLDDATHQADGHNPLCGDALTLYARVSEDGRVEELTFQGTGCAISVASSSLMTERVKGKTREESLQLFEDVRRMLTDQEDEPAEHMEKLAALAGVREYPSRIKCASLGWHALKEALTGEDESISTE